MALNWKGIATFRIGRSKRQQVDWGNAMFLPPSQLVFNLSEIGLPKFAAQPHANTEHTVTTLAIFTGAARTTCTSDE
ncbi:hypothetical protein [Acetobacter conturbans]|uniref:Uncharacterized protein n=1 Tax=Acetobacter conturbans TaxID=1737472 RepID=A0ABX0JVZ8_9PROT|nr:hypothetical protein [Acetobacter conturbans]NHN87401.1 hypothetical protein [Acetobacter conturbans]